MTASAAKKTTATPKEREILVILRGGVRRKVSGIPANAKITYGPVSPGQRDYSAGNALRIYTTESNQLAVFVNVEEFRDLSLTVAEEKVTRKESADEQRGPKGRRRSADFEETREWEDA